MIKSTIFVSDKPLKSDFCLPAYTIIIKMAAAAIVPARYKMLMSKYLEAKMIGLTNQFDITALDDTLEHYRIVFRPQSGLYRDQTHILELHTSYGSNEAYKYPQDPPHIHFLTQNFHTNINQNGGGVCVDFIYNRKQWLPTYTFTHIICAVQLLYMQPENDGAHLNGAATNLYNECLAQFKAMVNSADDVKTRDACFDTCFQPFKDRADKTWREGPPPEKYAENFPGLLEIPQRCWPLPEEVDSLKAMYESIAGSKALQRLIISVNPIVPKTTGGTQANTAVQVSVSDQLSNMSIDEAPNSSVTQSTTQSAATTQLTAEERAARLRRAPKPTKAKK